MFARLRQHVQHLHRAAPATATQVRNMSDVKRPDITLYTAQTPNGIKVSIALEELGYELISLLESFSNNVRG